MFLNIESSARIAALQEKNKSHSFYFKINKSKLTIQDF